MKKRYKDRSVKELRQLAKERSIGTGIWRAGARQAELVKALLDSDEGKPFHGSKPSLPPQPELPEPLPNGNGSSVSSDIGAVLAGAIQPHLATKVDESQVIDLIREHGSGMDVDTLHKLCVDIIKQHTAPMELVIKSETGELLKKISRQHWKFELLLKVVEARIPAMLVGPAGTGKTHATSAVAEAIGLPYEGTSFGPMTTKADLFGYKDANGIYHDTGLIRTALKGGVFLGDEMDAGNAGVLTSINMMLANGHVATPTGMHDKHKDFVFVGCANTFGTGANRQYVGRNQLDAASLDRFAFIEWPADEGLEASLVGCNNPSPELRLNRGGLLDAEQWLDYVQKVRRAVEKLGVRMLVGQRAILNGAKLIQLGVGRSHLEEMLIWKGIDKPTRDKVTAAL